TSSGIDDDADVAAVIVRRTEKCCEHLRAAALAPGWAALAVVSANVIRRFFRRVDMCVPINDHAEPRSTILCLWPATRQVLGSAPRRREGSPRPNRRAKTAGTSARS